MKRTSLGLLMTAAVILAGCGGEEFTTAGASLDATQGDAGEDVRTDASKLDTGVEASPDASPDAQPDAIEPDVTPDAGQDAQPDVVEPDAQPDTGTDAQPDQDVPDTAQPETGVDAQPEPQPEAGPEPQPEASIDASPEAETSVDASSEAETSVDASPEAETSVDAQPDTQVESGTDAAQEADAGCIEGARRCLTPVLPQQCSGGHWVSGGLCNFGCTGEGICRCVYNPDPFIQKIITITQVPGAACGGTQSVTIDGMVYMPTDACGSDGTQILTHTAAENLNPHAVLPTLTDLRKLMVQTQPITMTQCEDGQPFYAFERTYFSRDTSVSNCFWTATGDAAWWKVILADGTETSKSPSTLCQFFAQYYE